MKYAVTAASGQLGRLIVNDLLTHLPADEVVAIARTPERLTDLSERGVEVRVGDYDDASTLRAAFTGVDVALLISGWDIGRRVRQHERAIHAAREAGLDRLAYTSTIDWGDGNLIIAEHQETEQMLRDSGLGWTILRDHLYVEPYEVEVEVAAGTGTYRTSVQGAGAAFVTRGDVARCASVALREASHRDVVYDLTGPTPVTPDDFATAAAEIRGTPVAVEEVSRDELRSDYLARGMEGHLLEIALELEDVIRSGALAGVSADVESLLGRPGTSFRDHMLATVGARLRREGS